MKFKLITHTFMLILKQSPYLRASGGSLVPANPTYFNTVFLLKKSLTLRVTSRTFLAQPHRSVCTCCLRRDAHTS